MRKILAVFFILFAGSIYAQRSVEVGLMLGFSNYDGELTKSRWENPHGAGGIVGRFNLNDYFTLKGNAFYGNISGADSLAPDAFRKERNLSFKSFIFEFGGMLEWNIFGYDPLKTRSKKFSPFLFAGVSIYKYNPKAYLNGDWIELQPLSTEGQGTTQFQDRKKYALTQVAIPLGAGFKYRFSRGWTFSVEYGLRKTFDDYLDDVSKTYVDPGVLSAAYGAGSASVQLADRSPEAIRESRNYDPLTFDGPGRGNPKTTDYYAYGGITITYTILGNRVKCFKF